MKDALASAGVCALLVWLAVSLTLWTAPAQERRNPFTPKPIKWSDFGDGWIEINWLNNPAGRWTIFHSNAVRALEVYDIDPITKGVTLTIEVAGQDFRFDMDSEERAKELATFIARHD